MTNDLNPLGNCPSAAEIAALVDGRLSGERRAQVQSHISACDDCFEVFADVNHALADAPEVVAAVTGAPNVVTWRPRFLARPAAVRTFVGLAAAAAVALAVVGPRWMARSAGDSPELRELVAAAQGQRPIEGRLSGGFQWAPVSATRSAAGTEAAPDIRIAAAQLEKSIRASRTPGNLGAYAVARLFVGDVDGAVRSLEEATALDKGNARLWSDLSASYLARGRSGSAVDLPRALEAAERAARLDATLVEPLFNRALVLEGLGLQTQATEAWRQYLARDTTSDWASEAKDHLNRLTATRPQTEDLQDQRQRLFGDVLPAWAEAVQKHDETAAASALRDAHQLVRQLADVPGDRFGGDVLEAVSRAQASGGPALRALVNGHRAYGAARALYAERQFDRAGTEFDRAWHALDAGGSRLALSARFYSAQVAYNQGHLEVAREPLEDLARTPTLPAYPSLGGRIDWTLGVIAYRSGAYELALQRYLSAASAFGASQESSNAAFVEGLLAEVHERLGRPEEAWNHRIKALAGNPRPGLLLSASRAAHQMGWLHVAAALQDASIEAARNPGPQENLVDALKNRAITDCALGETAAGGARLREASGLTAKGSGAAWDRLRAEVDLAGALCVDAASAAEGIAAASRAASYFSGAGDLARLTEVLTARARAERLAGQASEARRDLQQALALMDAERLNVEAGAARAEFAERARHASNELVRLEMNAGNTDAALRAADRIRGWDLRAAPTTAQSATGVSEILAAIDDHTTLAYYVVCSDESFVWIVRHGGMSVERIPAGAADLDQLTWNLANGELPKEASAALERLIIDPVGRHVGADDLLVVIPDGALHRVPFAAMKLASGRRLIEDHALLLSPSAAHFVEASRLASGFAGAPERILSVGNPTIDVQRYPALPALPWAESEAREVAETYAGRAVLLIGRDATDRAVRQALPTVDVAHFAVHAVADESDPDRGELVLSAASGDRLTGRAVQTLSSPRLRLVVLGACRTLAGRSTASQGPLGIARAFIQAGVPDVVASPWDVDDRATRLLLVAFHRAFARSGDASRALRTAQLEMLHSSDPDLSRPSRWAGLVVIGGQRRIVAND